MNMDSIKKELKNIYPYNLANAVTGDSEVTDILFSVYIPALLESVEDLSEREQKVLDYRYAQKMTLEQVGNEIGVSRERIRQIEAKAIRKLRHPRYSSNWKVDTIKRYEARASELEQQNIVLTDKISKIYDALGIIIANDAAEPQTPEAERIPIDDMELSVRSYNCLKRANINLVSDLDGKSVNDLRKIRNIGRKSIKEIITKAKEFGIEISEEESYVR